MGRVALLESQLPSQHQFRSLRKFQAKQLRDQKLVSRDLPMTIPKCAYEFRRKLVCPRADPESPYDNPTCRDETCDKCRNLALLDGNGDGGVITKEELQLGAEVNVKWETWVKYTDAAGKERTDFLGPWPLARTRALSESFLPTDRQWVPSVPGAGLPQICRVWSFTSSRVTPPLGGFTGPG